MRLGNLPNRSRQPPSHCAQPSRYLALAAWGFRGMGSWLDAGGRPGRKLGTSPHRENAKAPSGKVWTLAETMLPKQLAGRESLRANHPFAAVLMLAGLSGPQADSVRVRQTAPHRLMRQAMNHVVAAARPEAHEPATLPTSHPNLHL